LCKNLKRSLYALEGMCPVGYCCGFEHIHQSTDVIGFSPDERKTYDGQAGDAREGKGDERR